MVIHDWSDKAGLVQRPISRFRPYQARGIQPLAQIASPSLILRMILGHGGPLRRASLSVAAGARTTER